MIDVQCNDSSDCSSALELASLAAMGYHRLKQCICSKPQHFSERSAMRLKRWESPRREGRNDKGKRSSARQRQLKKQTQVWRKKLSGNHNQGLGSSNQLLPLFFWNVRTDISPQLEAGGITWYYPTRS
jgi:hypothetical protein